MEKKLALSFIGGTPTQAAAAVGVSRSAISQWPDPLPASLVDRVLAAWVRKNVADLPEVFRLHREECANASSTQEPAHD